MKYLSDYLEKAQTEAFETTGSFFAFGQKQFNERKIEGVKYVNMGTGLVCPKGKEKELQTLLDIAYEEAIIADVKENGAYAIIQREYFNHECQIVMDRSAMLDAIAGHVQRYPEKFTQEVINKAAKEAFNEAVENNWF